MPKASLLVVFMVSLLKITMGQFTREAIYHSMNDRGVYLPDDYNSDLPPAQVTKLLNFALFKIMLKKIRN